MALKASENQWSVVFVFPTTCPTTKPSANRCVIESRSRTKTVVSSAYSDTLMSFLSTLIPFIVALFLIALASISIPITKSNPDKGQPYRTPLLKRKILMRGHCLIRSL